MRNTVAFIFTVAFIASLALTGFAQGRTKTTKLLAMWLSVSRKLGISTIWMRCSSLSLTMPNG